MTCLPLIVSSSGAADLLPSFDEMGCHSNVVTVVTVNGLLQYTLVEAAATLQSCFSLVSLTNDHDVQSQLSPLKLMLTKLQIASA